MSLKSFFTSRIFPILLVNFIGILGYSIVIPILIFIVSDLGGNGFIYGILGATYPFFQFIGAPILGRLSDRIGRKKVLILSQLGTFVAWALFLVAFALPETKLWEQGSELTGEYVMTLPLLIIFVARIFDGFTGGNISVANAYLSDISTDEDRSANFGKMGSSTSLGFVLGPAVAGLLASTVWGEALPVALAALISLIAIVVINYRLSESVACVVDTGPLTLKRMRRFFQVEIKDCYTEGEEESDAKTKTGWSRVLSINGIPLLYGVFFLTFLGFSLFYAGLPIYANTVLGWSASDLGIFLAVNSFGMILVQGPVLSRISKTVSSENLVLIGSILLACSFMLLSQQNTVAIYGANVLLFLGNGIMWPSFLSILSSKGSASVKGAVQGYGNSMGSIASMFGLVLGGVLFESIGTMVFLLGGCVFVLIGLLLIVHRYKHRGETDSQSPTITKPKLTT